MKPRDSHRRRLCGGVLAAVTFAGACLVCGVAAATPASSGTSISSTGPAAGQIKHVWLIILENKSYDATFSGLNQNNYLWQTLPRQGALLTNYYATGHASMDNYLTLVSGQAPQSDTQSDCSLLNKALAGALATSGANAGQWVSPANASQSSGANAPNGQNGCTYPTDVATLFNQFDAAGVTWKGYAQDFRAVGGREDGPCGAPGTSDNNPWTNPVPMADLNSAIPGDQYVAKHFPFPWFASLTGVYGDGVRAAEPLTTPVTGGSDCDANHIADLDDASTGLSHDMQSESTTPAFSWITPDNCSDGHDAVCRGNNMSGAFLPDQQPNYRIDPQSTTPANYTGGLYAADLFLQYYVPMIERSPAFHDGGLIDITFDESSPPFAYTGNSFANANTYGPTATIQPNVAAMIAADAAGENLDGRNVATEPTGPNSTLSTASDGAQLFPGPGDNAFLDRPPACTSRGVPAGCVQGLVTGAAGSPPAARTDAAASGTAGSSIVADQAITATDTGRLVTAAGGPGGGAIAGVAYVGVVNSSGPQFPTSNTGVATVNSFQLVDKAGAPVTLTGAVTGVTLSAEAPSADPAAGITADPVYDAVNPTPGGGDTGSVLISPLIVPGTVSSTYYNHYSWLRTMEDIFQVSDGTDRTPLFTGDFSRVIGGSNTNGVATVSGGLDGLGHLGFAAQAGLMPFGPDVFTNAKSGALPTGTSPTASALPGGPAPDAAGDASPRSGVSRAAATLAAAVLLVLGAMLFATKRRNSR